MPRSRSEQMARIRGNGTTPEVVLETALRSAGLPIAHRPRVKPPVGRPDLVIIAAPIYVAVFIDGCFWHGCPDHYVPPRSRIEFWAAKLAGNVTRDHRQTLALEAAGWRVVRLWEHEVFEALPAAVEKVRRSLRPRRPRRTGSMRVLRVEWLDAERVLERRFLSDLRDLEKVEIVERPRQTRKARPRTGKQLSPH
jgi:DNA mismatch endonuclease (patch repair protein)